MHVQKEKKKKSTHNHCNMKMKKTSTFDFFPKQIKAQNFSQGSFKCPNRSVSCGNNGALATHMKANHSNQKDAGTIFKYVLDCKAVSAWEMDPAKMTVVRKLYVPADDTEIKKVKWMGVSLTEGGPSKSHTQTNKKQELWVNSWGKVWNTQPETGPLLHSMPATKVSFPEWFKNADKIYAAADYFEPVASTLQSQKSNSMIFQKKNLFFEKSININQKF